MDRGGKAIQISLLQCHNSLSGFIDLHHDKSLQLAHLPFFLASHDDFENNQMLSVT